MEISTAITMGPSVKGLDIEGELSFIGEVKAHEKTYHNEDGDKVSRWKTQFILLKEGDIKTGANVNIDGDPITNDHKGKRIKLVNCNVGDSEYEGKATKIIWAKGWTPPDASAKLQEITNSAPAEKEESPFKKNLPALKEDHIWQKENLIVREVAAKGAAIITAAAIKGCNPTTEVCKNIFSDMATHITEWIKS